MVFENLDEDKAKELYDKFILEGMSEDDAFNEVYSIECNLDNIKDFFDIKVGDVVIVYDNYAEHRLLVEAVEHDDDFVTETNPDGMHCYGRDLEYWNDELQDYEDDDYVTHIWVDNFIGFWE